MNSSASSVMVFCRSRPLIAVVLPFEGDAGVVEREEPRVGDRDAVGVAREIGEHGLGAGERALGVDDPFAAAQRRERGVEGALVGERRELAEEGEAAGVAAPRDLREIAGGTDARARARAGRSRAGRRSSASRPATGRRRGR